MKASQSLEPLFNLAPRNLKALSFSRADKLSIESWVNNLPVADPSKSTRMLYVAIKEICDLDTSAATRLDLLKALQPAIHHATTSLQKNYLHQPIILPEQPRKIALLCQALHHLLANGFVICACQYADKMNNIIKKPTSAFSQSIFNALLEYSNMLLRDFVLYKEAPAGFWATIHRLFQLSRKHQLHHIEHQHPKFSELQGTPETAYLQLLLWGSIKANQLRQEDLLRLEQSVWTWAKTTRLMPLDKTRENVFVVDPTLDTPPVYQKFYRGQYPASAQALDTEELTQQLKQLTSPLAQKQAGLSNNLINHLILAWGVFTGRTFMRLETNSALSLCVGLTTTHYYLSNKKTFAEFIYGDTPPRKEKAAGASEFKAQLRSHEKLDVWDESMFGTGAKSTAEVAMESIDYHIRTGGQSAMTATGTDQEKYQHFVVSAVNMSPGGYCLEWGNNAPHSIKSGELIGIKEEHHVTWNIGSIRWVRQNKEESLQIGVELLSPSAVPYGARIADAEGKPKSDFMRVLVLPEIKTAGQPHSILTPAVAFKSGQYVLLSSNGSEQCIELNKILSSTGSYFQFAYTPMKSIAPSTASGKMAHSTAQIESDLDSVWNLLE